ncbi:MAG: isoprenylcysteine carboxylmethyltransferase family protein [Anaerolineales bacterium]|jgi:protein-S-isoprenylcysteine O-methyltransferase Ste14
MSTPPETLAKDTSMKKDLLSRGIQVVFGALIIGIILFLTAGRLDWTMGWVYMGVYVIGLVINMFIMLAKNPEVAAGRARTPDKDTPRFDKIFAAVYTPSLLAIFIVSGLDAGRYSWSRVPAWVQVLSIVVFIIAWLFSLWAMVSNKHFETTVRIQVERGHKTISSGPYGIVRHPGYVSFVLMWSATPTFLGSWWGLIPAGILAVAFILRTAREDQTLLEELPDYAVYAEKVRFRLLPGVW